MYLFNSDRHWNRLIKVPIISPILQKSPSGYGPLGNYETSHLNCYAFFLVGALCMGDNRVSQLNQIWEDLGKMLCLVRCSYIFICF